MRLLNTWIKAAQNFLQRCFKRKYISYQIDIYNVLEEVDHSLFKISSMPGYPLYPSVPKKAQCASEFLAVNSLGLIPSVLKIVIKNYDHASFIEELANVPFHIVNLFEILTTNYMPLTAPFNIFWTIMLPSNKLRFIQDLIHLRDWDQRINEDAWYVAQ